MGSRYDGPIIDAHHHLWDLSLGRHPWIASDTGAIKALGDVAYLRRDYLVADYLRDVGSQRLAGSVYVEAAWDRDRPPTEEVDWVGSLDRPGAVAARCVAWAPLGAPDAAATLDALAQRPSVVGVRETIRWHPDPARRWVEAGIVDRPDWRRGFERLREHGLLLELLMNPYQADDVARLAHAFPDQCFVVNHCGTPVERDPEGMARWRDGLRTMGRCENVFLKLSNFGAYATDASHAARRAVVMTCIEAFGTDRALFGTDYPVGLRTMKLGEYFDSFRDCVSEFSDAEQSALLHDNAARLYRFA